MDHILLLDYAGVAVFAAAESRAAELSILQAVDAAPAAHDLRAGAHQAAAAVDAALARRTGDSRSVPAAVVAGAAVHGVTRGIDARVAALHESFAARERAAPGAAHATDVADFARVLVAGGAAARGAAVIAILQWIDAQLVTFDELYLARQRARPAAAQIAWIADHTAAATVPAIAKRVHASGRAVLGVTAHEPLRAG